MCFGRIFGSIAASNAGRHESSPAFKKTLDFASSSKNLVRKSHELETKLGTLIMNSLSNRSG